MNLQNGYINLINKENLVPGEESNLIDFLCRLNDLRNLLSELPLNCPLTDACLNASLRQGRSG
jgi:hypothetical protein